MTGTEQHTESRRRRRQFTLRGLLVVMTVCAVLLSIGSMIGWLRVLRVCTDIPRGVMKLATTLATDRECHFVVLCIAHLVGPMLAFFAWIPVRRQALWLRVLLPALPLVLLMAGMASWLNESNPKRVGDMLQFTVAIWAPQAIVWYVVGAFIRRGEKRDDEPCEPASQTEHLKAVEEAFLAELTERTCGNQREAAVVNLDDQGAPHA